MEWTKGVSEMEVRGDWIAGEIQFLAPHLVVAFSNQLSYFREPYTKSNLHCQGAFLCPVPLPFKYILSYLTPISHFLFTLTYILHQNKVSKPSNSI